MASVNDYTTKQGQVYRLAADSGLEFWRKYTPWGAFYRSTSLSEAKALVPLTNTGTNERVVILYETATPSVTVWMQKATGYSSTFDLSFEILWDSRETYITTASLETALGLIDISALDGITSTSTQVEAAIADAVAHDAILAGVDNSSLTDAISKAHTQGTDTGTTSASFIVRSAHANKVTLDASSVTTPTTIDLEDVATNLGNSGGEIGYPVPRYPKSTLVAEARSAGRLVCCTDIDTSTEFLMMDDGYDFVSGVYILQLNGSKFTASPSVGDCYVYNNNVWECIDATSNQEVFRMTRKIRIVDHTIGEAIAASDAIDGVIHTNRGAGGSITLTLPSAVKGYKVTVYKIANQDVILQAATGDTVGGSSAGKKYKNTASETNVLTVLETTDATDWIQTGAERGTWAVDNA